MTYPEVEQPFKGKKMKKTSGCSRDTMLWKGHFQQRLEKPLFRIAKASVVYTHRANVTFSRNTFDGWLVFGFLVVCCWAFFSDNK